MEGSPRLWKVPFNGVTTCQASATPSAASTIVREARTGRVSTAAASTGPAKSEPSRVTFPPTGFGNSQSAVPSSGGALHPDAMAIGSVIAVVPTSSRWNMAAWRGSNRRFNRCA